jgi:hypothetical protein
MLSRRKLQGQGPAGFRRESMLLPPCQHQAIEVVQSDERRLLRLPGAGYLPHAGGGPQHERATHWELVKDSAKIVLCTQAFGVLVVQSTDPA